MASDHFEMMISARSALLDNFGGSIPVCLENIEFEPPADGGMWLKFDYIEADTRYLTLDRKCLSYIGLVQIGVVFRPGSGTDDARELAKAVANAFPDGLELGTGYIFEGAILHPIQKHETGWFIPVRYQLRLDVKGV